MKFTPDEFVNKLDEKVISQTDAKRTLAIALRNRWRRTQLSKEISDMITPKNIMLIGSTGVGKTAIIKALADIVEAPMVKVEATKYTQVGYVGESVNNMIEALAVEGFARFNKIKQSKYSKSDDYNKFLLVKKANVLIKEIEKRVREDFNALYDDFFNSDVVEMKLERKEKFYQEEDINKFNKDYLENDHKIVDWVFDHKLVVELLMMGLGFVPEYLTENIKSKPKKEKFKKELSVAIDNLFKESKLLVAYFNLMLFSNRPNWNNDKMIYVGEHQFRSVLEELEKRLDKSFLPYYQSYVNYIHRHLGETPFIYEKNEGVSDTDKETEDINKNDDLIKGFKDHIEYTENMGIVFIDEIDKLAETGGGKENIGKLGVQRDLLAILDGTTVDTTKGAIKTDNILFIAAGAFHVADVSDLMPELLGRLPINVKLEDMNVDLLENILKNEKVSPINQYIQLLSADNIVVKVEDGLLRTIAEVANRINKNYRNMGARTLHLVIDRIFAKYALETASEDSKKTINITRADVMEIKRDFDKKNRMENLKKYIELKSKLSR